MADFNFLLNLTPEEAIAYLKAKGYKITFSYKDMWQHAHDTAFTVAKIAKLDVLQEIKDALIQALQEGQTYQDFQNNLRPFLMSKGWINEHGQSLKNLNSNENQSLRRLKVIYNTNLNIAQAKGRYDSAIENVANRPYFQYHAVLDSNTRPWHRRLDGFVAKAGDKIWSKIYPPNGWNCRCMVVALSPSEVKSFIAKNPDSIIKPTQEEIDKSVPAEWQYNPANTELKVDDSKYDSNLLRSANGK